MPVRCLIGKCCNFTLVLACLLMALVFQTSAVFFVAVLQMFVFVRVVEVAEVMSLARTLVLSDA